MSRIIKETNFYWLITFVPSLPVKLAENGAKKVSDLIFSYITSIPNLEVRKLSFSCWYVLEPMDMRPLSHAIFVLNKSSFIFYLTATVITSNCIRAFSICIYYELIHTGTIELGKKEENNWLILPLICQFPLALVLLQDQWFGKECTKEIRHFEM